MARNFGPIIKARKALEDLWKEACLKGRCWGPIKEDNPFSATNITFAVRNELVSISQASDGTLTIHEFKKTPSTILGNQVREILHKEGLEFETEGGVS